MYEQYYGDEVGLFGKDKRQKDPHAISAEVTYTPVPLLTLSAGHKQGKKGIIKIADRFFEDDVLNRIALVAPHVTLNVIRDYKVVEKKQVEQPKEFIGIVRCPNPKCIVNHEPMPTRFESATDSSGSVLICSYCGRKVKNEQVELL